MRLPLCFYAKLQRANAGDGLVGNDGDEDALNRGGLAREVKLIAAVVQVAAATDGAVAALRLRDADEVAAVARAAVGGEAQGEWLDVGAAVDVDGNGVGVKRRVAARNKGLAHGESLWMLGNGGV